MAAMLVASTSTATSAERRSSEEVCYWSPKPVRRVVPTTDPVPRVRVSLVADEIPDIDDLPEMIAAPFPTSFRSDSLSSSSTTPPPSTPDSSSFPLPPNTHAARIASTPTASSSSAHRHPSSASSSSHASKATLPRSILARSASARSAAGSAGRKLGSVKFAARPVVLSCRYEVDGEEEDAEMGVLPGVREVHVGGVSVDTLEELPPPPPLPVLRPEKKKKRSLFQRLAASLGLHKSPRPPTMASSASLLYPLSSPAATPAASSASVGALPHEPYARPFSPDAPSFRSLRVVPSPPSPPSQSSGPNASPNASVRRRASARRSADYHPRAHGGAPPAISGPMPLGTVRPTAGTGTRDGDARSVRSVRSIRSLGSMRVWERFAVR